MTSLRLSLYELFFNFSAGAFTVICLILTLLYKGLASDVNLYVQLPLAVATFVLCGYNPIVLSDVYCYACRRSSLRSRPALRKASRAAGAGAAEDGMSWQVSCSAH